jgi:beta-galactosidase
MKLIIGFILICIVCLCAARNFTHDSKNGVFLKDGKPFRYISGDLEYFKVPSVHWKDRLNKYKLAGLNTIQTYIEWRSHEPEKGQYDFSGDNDVVNFLKLANETGLLVVLRPGPFVNAERDNGGLPYWLQGNNPNMVIRSADESYLKEVDQWFSVLFPKLVPLLYKNGGPIITVQVENEFGFYGVLSNDLKLCDTKYKNHLKDLFIKYLGNDVVLFTVDGLTPEFQKCGSVEGVFATTDFGIGTDPKAAFANQKLHNGFGPYVNSEYYTGWIEIWEWAHPLRSTKIVVDHFDTMLSMNASVNIYPFHGGTSFGFNPGANIGEENTFQPETTHYDFDAPLNEAGDPTEKFAAFREVIGKYEPLPKIALPTASPKMELPAITLTPIASIFDNLLLSEPTASKSPLTFEQLKLGHGFVRYSTTINFDPTNPSVLSLNETGLRDRALIFVNEVYIYYILIDFILFIVKIYSKF